MSSLLIGLPLITDSVVLFLPCLIGWWLAGGWCYDSRFMRSLLTWIYIYNIVCTTINLYSARAVQHEPLAGLLGPLLHLRHPKYELVHQPDDTNIILAKLEQTVTVKNECIRRPHRQLASKRRYVTPVDYVWKSASTETRQGKTSENVTTTIRRCLEDRLYYYPDYCPDDLSRPSVLYPDRL